MKKPEYARASGFSLIELVMVIVIIGIMAGIALPRFVDFRKAASVAKGEATIGALRSAAAIYYSKTALAQFEALCTVAGNPYRDADVPNPCYPANSAELESLLTSTPDWDEGGSGACYNSSTGAVFACP
jgi:prepilin-type N-terminal cleavage/methylation domain-containing protein